jgi:nucleolar complex protein 3
LCSLIREKPDFNFAVNMRVEGGRRSVVLEEVDDGVEAELVTVIPALATEAISALLNLRLKEELGGGRIRASASAVFRESEGKHHGPSER